MTTKHWSKVEYLHKTVTNPNIHIRGTHSYYSDYWSGSFEQSVVRYLYGDEYSLANWQSQWPIDQLYIGDYVCIAAEAVILMGGNHTHRAEWFSLYPFEESLLDAYQGKGDTIIADGAWLGLRSIILPGIKIGEGAIVAAASVVTKDVPAYTIVAGNPAKMIRKRFDDAIIDRLLSLKIYDLNNEQFDRIKPFLVNIDIENLEKQLSEFSI
ncbi:MAG: CatB-related O-acetyltransferase [Tatlockia sp.]|nr:CatB-related O-acetyltransferase [Tatlockia sp.]